MTLNYCQSIISMNQGSYTGSSIFGKQSTIKSKFSIKNLSSHEPVFEFVESAGYDVEIKDLEKVLDKSVICRIDRTMSELLPLYEEGKAEKPIAPEAIRDFLVKLALHARDLNIVMEIMGYPKDKDEIHDLYELIDVSSLNMTGSFSCWYQRWLRSLPQDGVVNIGALNPNLTASFYTWSTDTGREMQDAMHAHRFSKHHNNPKKIEDIIEHAVNFVMHHVPLEHFGVRGEGYNHKADECFVEQEMLKHYRIRNSTIEIPIGKDAFRLIVFLQKELIITPWGKLSTIWSENAEK